MAINSGVIGGAFNSLYVGNYSASTPLTKINIVGTGGYKLRYSIPKDRFSVALKSYPQSGLCTIQLDLSFISDDPIADNLAMGNPITTTPVDTPSSNQQYVILLIDSINSGASVLVPRCESNTELNIVRVKNLQNERPIQFNFADRSSITQLFYKRSNSALGIILGPANPGF